MFSNMYMYNSLSGEQIYIAMVPATEETTC